MLGDDNSFKGTCPTCGPEFLQAEIARLRSENEAAGLFLAEELKMRRELEARLATAITLLRHWLAARQKCNPYPPGMTDIAEDTGVFLPGQ